MSTISFVKLNRSGIKVDAAKIGAGLYDLVCQKGDDAIVAFGMIPKWIVDILDRQLEEKIIELFAAENQIEPALAKEIICPDSLKDMVRSISKECTLAMFDAASKAGKLRV